MLFNALALVAALSLPSIVSAQLASGYTIGPLTTSGAKRAVKVCDVMDYGAVADMATDIGPPLLAAFNACKSGGVVEIPTGNYVMVTWVTLSGGSAWAINFEGVIYRNGTAGGNMIIIADSTDFELFSSRSSGAMQGYGYLYREQGISIYGARLMRLINVINFSVHDIALVDCQLPPTPAFHLVLETCQSGEVYNLIIRGGNEGGLDGIDASGFNLHIHDVEVTNKDECVTNPSNHFLIENIYCNWSGGCAIGSLGLDTDISKITYDNIYTQNANHMMMLKSNGGNGTVTTCTFSNFIGHNNDYSLDLNAYWSDSTKYAGDGVLYTDLTFSGWTGDCANGSDRAPIQLLCPSTQPCGSITIEDFNMWTDAGSDEYYKCENAWGNGPCLRGGSEHTSYAISTSTLTTATSWRAATMPSDITRGLGLTASIAIPTVPTTFFPGQTPATARAYP